MEYLLLVAVAMTIGIAFKKKMEEFVLKNPNSVLSKQINGLMASFNQDSVRFSRYNLRKF